MKLVVIVLCLFLSFIANSEQKISDINALISADPQEGLVQAKLYWQGKTVTKENLESGLLLISAYMKTKNYQKAADILDRFLALGDLDTDSTALLLARKLRQVRVSKSKIDSSHVYNQARLIIPQLTPLEKLENQKLALFELNQELGFKHYFAAEFNKAEPFFIQALKYIDNSNIQAVSDLLNTIGVVYAQQANLSEAAKFMLDSIKMLEKNNIPVGAIRYQNLGSLYFGLKDFDKSIEYSQKGISLISKPDKVKASLYSNMAAAQVEKGDFETAIKNLHKSIEINTKLNVSTASARNNLGYIYNQIGEYKKALEQLNLSASELDDLDNSELLGVSLKSRADVYAAMKNFDKALLLYEQAHAAFSEKDLKLKRVELYPKMLAVLEIKKNFKRAYEILKEFKKLNDDLTQIESTTKVNEILAKFDLEKKEKELQNSEHVREKQQQDIELLNNNKIYESKIRELMYILLATMAAVLLLVFLSWRFRGKVNKLLLEKNNRIKNQHTKMLELNSQLKTQAEIDALTGLKNRHFITQMITEESVKKQQKHWCLMIIDLDDFKSINDTYGHQTGDEVLVQFARCLKNIKGTNDVVARWGGEEFLWLSEMTSSNTAPQKCQAFQSMLAAQQWLEKEQANVTCSIGFSSFPLINMNFEDWEATLRLADYALYQAKNAGKDCCVGFEIIDKQFDYEEIKDIEKLVNCNHLRLFKST